MCLIKKKCICIYVCMYVCMYVYVLLKEIGDTF